MQIFWARLASFPNLDLISDPLIVSKFHNENNDPKGQENKIYIIVYGMETFYRSHTVPITKPETQMCIFYMVSREYVHENQDEQLEVVNQCHVHLVVKNLPYSDEKLEDIKLATKNDSTLTSVIV